MTCHVYIFSFSYYIIKSIYELGLVEKSDWRTILRKSTITLSKIWGSVLCPILECKVQPCTLGLPGLVFYCWLSIYWLNSEQGTSRNGGGKWLSFLRLEYLVILVWSISYCFWYAFLNWVFIPFPRYHSPRRRVIWIEKKGRWWKEAIHLRERW